MLSSMRRTRIQCNIFIKGFSSLTFQTNGTPSAVLKFQPATAASAPGVGEVKVSMKSFPVLVEDILGIKGLSLTLSKPGVAGSTGAGVVTSVGPQSTNISSSDLVFVSSNACWTQDVIVPTTSVVKIPKLSSAEIAMIPATVSAIGILSKFQSIKSGDAILQLNGDSDIGKAITQIGKEKGYKVINVKVDDLNDTASFMKTNGSSIKFAISGTSGKPTLALMKVLAEHGSVVSYNSASFLTDDFGAVDIPIRAFIFSDVSLHGFNLSTFASTNPSAFQSAVTEAVSLIQSKKVSLTSSVFPIAEYNKAIAAVEKSSSVAVLEL